jgi:hypothetical protein
MRSRTVWGASVAVIIVACTTNTTGTQGGGRAGGAACDYDSECESKTCTGGKGAAPPSGSSSGGSSGEGEGEGDGVGPGSSSVRPLGTCANPTTSSGGTSSGGTSSSGSSGNPSGGQCGRAGVGSKELTCADCTSLGPGYRCATIRAACSTCDESTYCYYPCQTDADCACDSFAPRCGRPQLNLVENVGTVCLRN